MAAKRKVAPKPDYTRRSAGCVVYTVEVCMRNCDVDDAECLGRGIEEFRNYGAAEIVQVDAVAESWDDACTILQKRAIA